MASVDEVRAGVQHATGKAGESVGALQQAISALEEARQTFAQVMQGTSQSDAGQVDGLLQQALQSIGDAQQTVNAAVSTAESLASRL
ncbi:hypothetical protein LX15_005774 [Streptoalloteichus tenebrarius]|uniref:Uncharacterized protein n=1 Tax=Streptoalloteichus tenebrarius (strain ATCC 17920 / DSM 40477 / JCM 4838 / CBS 697.72 / NBRC 16177 / NCIMB 11028 / NRRL B-12390 / A12253. 1 / ISP 5477) TaxID=1933 RepID=A0ABT1I2M4_STRSD|nr:hypothetical protein [Streptoalloteichus tenebrarius]MCP2262042.1 hypothetical protein [Streptoalloteichus tenebrarius]